MYLVTDIKQQFSKTVIQAKLENCVTENSNA